METAAKENNTRPSQVMDKGKEKLSRAIYMCVYIHIYMCVYIYMCVCVCVCVKGYSARDLVLVDYCRAENYLSNDNKYVKIR